MTLINKFQIDRKIKTRKSESELTNSIKKFDYKKIDAGKGIITIYGKAFYDFVCEIKPYEVKLIEKPKKILLVFVLTFFNFLDNRIYISKRNLNRAYVSDIICHFWCFRS